MSLSQAAAAMNASARWQEIISENLAAASIPGFKRSDVSFEAIQTGANNSASLDSQLGFTAPRATQTISFQQGELRPTSSQTDVAIEGPGFFEVELPSGATGYTRDGEFHIDAQGQLVTKQGYAVLGEGGPIQLDPNNKGALSIAPTGEVSQGSDLTGKIKVVNFEKPELLTPTSSGLFIAKHLDLRPEEVAVPSLRQGYLESANTSSVLEMANLIASMRAFEANQRVLQIHDQHLGEAITTLGGPS